MSKPLTKGHRRGGRNAQFFTSLSGLQRGLDAAIDRNTHEPTSEEILGNLDAQKSKISAAQAKRDRKNAKRAKEHGHAP